MLSAGIIYPINKKEWESPMVVQLKKHDPKKFKICVHFRGINKLTLMDSFLTPLANKIINEVAGHECYSFSNGFLAYNQVPIVKEDQLKMAFVIEFGSFSYKVIPFGINNSQQYFQE
jgi:hypothetical protein